MEPSYDPVDYFRFDPPERVPGVPVVPKDDASGTKAVLPARLWIRGPIRFSQYDPMRIRETVRHPG
jgi:hypothetical protein